MLSLKTMCSKALFCSWSNLRVLSGYLLQCTAGKARLEDGITSSTWGRLHCFGEKWLFSGFMQNMYMVTCHGCGNYWFFIYFLIFSYKHQCMCLCIYALYCQNNNPEAHGSYWNFYHILQEVNIVHYCLAEKILFSERWSHSIFWGLVLGLHC